MAAGSLTTAALRHRPRQALLIASLAAVVGASAVLGPLYSRAVEQSVVRTSLTEAAVGERTVAAVSTGNEPPSTRRLVAAVDIGSPLLGRPVGGADTAVTVRAASGLRATAALASRDRLCAHLTLTEGSCPDGASTAAGGAPVLVSRRNAGTFGLAVGDRLLLADANAPATRLPAVVAGIYAPFDESTPYWAGRGFAGASPPASNAVQAGQAPTLDTLYADAAALGSRDWALLHTHADLAVRGSRATLDDLPALRALTGRVDARARTVSASAASELSDLVVAIDRERDRTRTVIPLLAVQLALLGVVVLGFVCAAATEARRPEVALARLRGQGAGATASLLLRELGLLVVVGTLAGVAIGALVARLATRAWLAPGLSTEPTPLTAYAAVAAVLVGLAAVAVTAAPTLRAPLTSLLRRVPPRASALHVGVVEGALVAVTGAGVVTLLSASRDGGSRGPVALLAPGLLAVAGGLLLGQLVVPLAGPLARRSLGRGRVAGSLAGTQLARRPALRRLIAIVTVACALLVFAVDTWSVAARHRESVAGVEAGAPVVLEVSARDARTLRSAVLAVDPAQRFATPVVASGSPVGELRTLAVEPAAFARIARWGGSGRPPSAAALATLRAPRVAPLELRGVRVHAVATSDVSSPQKNPPALRPTNLLLRLVTDRLRTPVTVDLGVLRNTTNRLSAAIPCASGCRLRQVVVRRTFGDFEEADVSLALTRLFTTDAAGRRTDLDLGPATEEAWQSVQDQVGNDLVAVQPTEPLTFVGSSFGGFFAVQRGDVPVVPPALTAGDVREREPTGGTFHAQAPDLTGLQTRYAAVGPRLPTLPRYGNTGVLIDLGQVADAAGLPTSFNTFSVWLARDDPAAERRLVRQLADRGVVVVRRDTAAAHAAVLARQGPTLALRLALLAGVVGLVLAAAALPIGVATSGGSRARDLAALRVVGVPARTVRAAAVREHLVVAVLGTLAGAVLGLVAAQVALPQVPLVVGPVPRVTIVHDPAWSAVLLATAVCVVLLVATSVAVGRSLAASARPALLRSER